MDQNEQKTKGLSGVAPITTRYRLTGGRLSEGEIVEAAPESSDDQRKSSQHSPRVFFEWRAKSRPMFSVAWERNLFLSLLLALLTIGLYLPITRAPFLNFEDPAYIAQNSHVIAGLKWDTVKWAFRSREQSAWQPLTWLSHALDCRLFGLNPTGPHSVNIFIHAISAVLLFLILATATEYLWRSLAVSALFAVHPINVESVAWIAQRKDILSTLFFLIALGAYGWYARRPGATRYLTVTSVFALALMSDTQVVTFPFVLVLLDYWPLHRFCQDLNPEKRSASTIPLRKLLLEKLPWFAMSAATTAITLQAASTRQADLPIVPRLENAVWSYWEYLGKAFWPADLAPVYPGSSVNLPAAIVYAIGLASVTALAVTYRRQRPFFIGWFWFLGTLVPMLGLVQFGDFAMADRFAYIPLLGIFLIVCWGGAELVSKWNIRKFAPAVIAAVAIVALAVVAHRQERLWRDNVKLWTHTVEVTRNNYVAEDNLATAVLEQGNLKGAIAHFRLAHQYRSDDPLSTLNLAIYEHMGKHYQAAIDGYTGVLAVTKDPRFTMVAWVNRGYSHYALKQYADAKQDFRSALWQQPDDPIALRGLGLIAQKHGNIDEALKDYRRSVEFKPSGAGFLLLAQALELKGQRDEASAARTMARNPLFGSPADAALVQELLQD